MKWAVPKFGFPASKFSPRVCSDPRDWVSVIRSCLKPMNCLKLWQENTSDFVLNGTGDD